MTMREADLLFEQQLLSLPPKLIDQKHGEARIAVETKDIIRVGQETFDENSMQLGQRSISNPTSTDIEAMRSSLSYGLASFRSAENTGNATGMGTQELLHQALKKQKSL